MAKRRLLWAAVVMALVLLFAGAAWGGYSLVLDQAVVNTDRPPYASVQVGGAVGLDGQGVAGIPVALRLDGPGGQLLSAEQVNTETSGKFSALLPLPAGTPSGTALLVAAAAGEISQQQVDIPPLPAAYYGSVKDANGQSLASGKVEAYLGGQKEKAGEIQFSNGFYGGSGGLDPKLVVSGTEADRGKSVTFKVIVGGQSLEATTTSSVLWQPGDVRRVDLTVAAAPQPPQDTTPPEVASTDPVNNDTGVPVSKVISVTFSEDVQAGANFESITLKDAAGSAVAVSKLVSGKVLTIRPNANLAYSTRYTVTIPAGAVKDLAGNALAQDYTFSFTTQAASGGGGGGGGAPAPSADKVEKSIQAGATTVAEISDKVKVEVPAGAVSGANASIVAEVVGDEKASGAGMPLLGRVVDVVLKNGTLSGNGKITITLYFDKSKLGEGQEPASFYYDEKAGKWVRLEGNVDADKGTVTVTVDHLTMFAVFAVAKEAPKPPLVSFRDMQGHWAAETVGRLAAMEIVSGYPDGTFEPENEITRAEVTAILARALKLVPGKEEDLKFKDSAAIPAWARGVVAAAAKEGLVKGYPQPDDTVTFEAGRPVSRVEMAALVVRILEKKISTVAPAELRFADTGTIPDWAKASVGVAVAKGIVAGYPDNTFRAKKPVTRAESAAMILRLLDALGSK